MVPPLPCEHVFHADDGFFDEPWAADLIENGSDAALLELDRRWAARLLAADPAEYAEPPLPLSPMTSQTVDARVAVMSARFGDNRNRPATAIRHPDDLARGDVDEARIECRRLRNGAVQETELRVYDPDATEGTDACTELIWDEFARRRLEVAKRILSKLKPKQRRNKAA